MRQLVSVVTDSSVAYFLTDDNGDQLEQVAQVVNRGLAVPAVVELGANLMEALKLNGSARKSVVASAPTPPRVVAAAPPALPKAAKPAKPARRPRVDWGLTEQTVVEDLRAHPGTTYSEIAERLTGSTDRRAVQSVTAHVHTARRRGHPIQLATRPALVPGKGGRRVGVKLALLTYEESAVEEEAGNP